jgi:hypothetical protein
MHPSFAQVIDQVHGRKDPSVSAHLATCRICRKMVLEAEACQALYLESAGQAPASILRQVSLRSLQSVLSSTGPREVAEKKKGLGLRWPALFAGIAALAAGGALYYYSMKEPAPPSTASDPMAALGTPPPPPEIIQDTPVNREAVNKAANRLMMEQSHRHNRHLNALARRLRSKILAADQHPMTQTAALDSYPTAESVVEATAVPTSRPTAKPTKPKPQPKPTEPSSSFFPEQAQQNYAR